jgi:hypothetical protein
VEFLRKAIRVGVYSITSTDNVLQADLDAAVVKPDTVMVSSLCQPLHEVLFPDAVYREEESQQQNLIAKLRQVANEIESQLSVTQFWRPGLRRLMMPSHQVMLLPFVPIESCRAWSISYDPEM